MKITILGSGGGEGYPATFCGCEHCNTARLVGGKSIRTLSQTLINDDLLIDLPADTAVHAIRHSLNLGDVSDILITHTHFDHFVPSILFTRGSVYAHNLKYPTIGLYGSPDVVSTFCDTSAIYKPNKEIEASIHPTTLSAYETRRVGKYTVTALPAKHAIGTLIALNYVITDGECTLLYLHDTGYPTDEVVDFLAAHFSGVDCVMMDATMGVANISDASGHMSFEQNKRLKSRLTERGIADSHTRFVANHITHNNAEHHEKIEEYFSGTGIEVSYDGKIIEL